MQKPEFEWNVAKAEANYRKHGVTFDEGATVFGDRLSVRIPDPDHSELEDRYVAIGLSSQGHMLIVSYTEREQIIRIISCRRATLAERRSYEEGV